MKTNKTRRIAITAAATVAASGMAMFTAAPAHAEPAWDQFQFITPISDKEPNVPQVAVNENGRAVAYWIQQDAEGDFRLQASWRKPGGEWKDPKYLSAFGQSVSYADVAINDSGRAVVTWIRNNRVQLRALSTTGKWSKVRNVSGKGPSAAYPAVDVNPQGAALVAWASYGQEDKDKILLARVKQDGAKKVWTLSKRQGNHVDLDTNRTGETVVAWTEKQNGLTPIRSRRLMNGELTTKATLVADANGFVSVSVNDGGDALAAYLRDDEGDSRVAVNAGVSGGGWGTSTYLSGAGHDSWVPDTAIAFDGTQVVVWRNEFNQIQATMRELGDVWPASSLIGSDTTVKDPMVVMNDAGDMAIGWGDTDPSLNLLIKPAGETGYLAPVNDEVTVQSSAYSIGIDGDGSVLEIHGAELGEARRMVSRFFDVTS